MDNFLKKLNQEAESITFQETIDYIENHFQFTPTAFINGDLKNEANQNNGSCKIFAFAKLEGLSQEKTLQLFGDFYRNDVLKNPDGNDHQNIRNFIKYGWDRLTFENDPLTQK